MGPKCDLPCVHGTKLPDLSCDCHGCYTGTGCNDTCGGHGDCVDDKCVCRSTDGFWGSKCTERGCPGVGESCSGRGSCSLFDQRCTCDSDWKGKDCSQPDCPGTPDCNSRGNCTVNSAGVPTCVDCHLSMGVACQLNCIHGHESPPNSQKCVCEACYGGDDCNVECSQRGSCGNGSCTCDAGYRGDTCQLLDCPG
ncbi:hypothetical protein NP493_132g02156 [Ridgeia piscesae]|uniref:EGF-like domain-containing protein n=1 Tax=Ridgeia piscesae TaxID=27915 RepID=A0AAD9UGL0_RIDPI|nr:hypothetical protein NP493_132g02156 [Ridgeia piscesae]